ncbi:hypothetical protein AMATHDRAFT_70774 [Amanita thiersii Skay4041]|uniref:DUF2421 domain-containing protein n=1 Tax=Amanita thiersii Skay4041 TaxID=703135 RepID=A0A2A9NE46_9AGAR|nr:hypothetical protein AMATHDRAFT_70774 [Amanita thiersii Skay4041]
MTDFAGLEKPPSRFDETSVKKEGVRINTDVSGETAAPMSVPATRRAWQQQQQQRRRRRRSTATSNTTNTSSTATNLSEDEVRAGGLGACVGGLLYPWRWWGKEGAASLPAFLQWIPANWSWSKLKPVIRAYAAGWTSAVLFVIPRVQIFIGQVRGGAFFFIYLRSVGLGLRLGCVSFVSPPFEPFLAVLERELLILLFSTLAWAWSCLGMRLADLARTNRNPNVTLQAAITGRYIEAVPTVIMAVFIFLGTVLFSFIRARQGPGPYLFPCVVGTIALIISLTTAVLFPFPYYQVGKSVLIPLTFHTALSLLASIFIFPSSISAQFTTRLQGVLSPLATSIELHRSILKTTNDWESFSSMSAEIMKAVGQAEDGLVPIVISHRLLKSDLIYSRFKPADFECIQGTVRRLTGRATGMGMYFSLIDPTREKFPVTPAPSVPSTPILPSTPMLGSRHPSPERTQTREKTETHGEDLERTSSSFWTLTRRRPHRSPTETPRSPRTPRSDSPTCSRPQSAHSPQHHHHHHHHHHPFHPGHTHSHSHSHSHRMHVNLLHHSLLHLASAKHEQAVGLFESQRYLNLEATRFHTPYGEDYTIQMLALLQESCDELLKTCYDSVVAARDWLGTVRSGRFNIWTSQREKEEVRKKKLESIQAVKDALFEALERFRSDKRHSVLEPYRRSFESHTEEGDNEPYEMPPHRYLFHCYVYQYHLMQFAGITVDMLGDIIRLETERRHCRVWTPVQRLFFRWHNWNVVDLNDDFEEEDPDLIQGVGPSMETEDLILPARRDPDALPPRNVLEWAMSLLYFGVASLAGGNVLFACKAGVLAVVLCLPSFFKSTAEVAYANRFVWAIFMGVLTIARFRGDTAFGLFARIWATLLGGVAGMVMWYIATGGGHHINAYGFAAVLAVCFPFFYYARLYWPGPPMTNIVFFVTVILVIGFSWLSVHNFSTVSTPAGGFEVAWRRFVATTAGVVAAYIMSFLPPSTTIRRYHRHTLATTCTEIGTIYCQILSFANSRKRTEVPEIVTSLLAVRSKLRRSRAMRTNVIYEFSFRGRWPSKRYQMILDIQLQVTYALSHLMSIMEHLEPAWTRAFLRRTRFNDSDFQGDVLAVITMISTSLRTGYPLPQITPCPLLDRFMLRYHGLEVIHKEFQDDYGLPRTLTLDTLKNEQYLMFCVGVSTAFSIMTRLDRLMLATKEIVGEQYHIHGIGIGRQQGAGDGGGGGGVELGSRTNSMQPRAPEIV